MKYLDLRVISQHPFIQLLWLADSLLTIQWIHEPVHVFSVENKEKNIYSFVRKHLKTNVKIKMIVLILIILNG